MRSPGFDVALGDFEAKEGSPLEHRGGAGRTRPRNDNHPPLSNPAGRFSIRLIQ
jgi:hypothetical protein